MSCLYYLPNSCMTSVFSPCIDEQVLSVLKFENTCPPVPIIAQIFVMLCDPVPFSAKIYLRFLITFL
jgi:hypothetical protein